MEEKVIKVRCPHCAGKIALDEGYFHELSGTTIHCPHCDKQLIVPRVPKALDVVAPDMLNVGKATMNLKPIIDLSLGGESGPADIVRCPHCGAEVGTRDRVCLSCEGKLIPKG